MTAAKRVIQPLDQEAVSQAKTLLRTARFGALAVLDPNDGAPLVSRVAVATDCDGAPLILVSGLSAHTKSLQADPRCSLLLGEPGKGDALAYPRLSLSCHARLVIDAPETERVRARFLRHVPKSALYASLPDFRIYRLEPSAGALNGGFGKAYRLQAQDILTENGFALSDVEPGILDDMNANQAVALTPAETKGRWVMTGVDPDGVLLALGDQVKRVSFATSITTAEGAVAALMQLISKNE